MTRDTADRNTSSTEVSTSLALSRISPLMNSAYPTGKMIAQRSIYRYPCFTKIGFYSTDWIPPVPGAMFSVGVSRAGARNDNLAAIKDPQLHIYYVVGGVKKSGIFCSKTERTERPY
jgi:hypothetical protein